MDESLYARDFTTYQKRTMDATMGAYKQDLDMGDITTEAFIQGTSIVAHIRTKEPCVVCGILEAKTLFEEGGVMVLSLCDEGERIDKDTVVMTLQGNSREIISRSRTALAYLQVLSGIATKTRALASKYPKQIATTRKTHPGMLFSEKRAVAKGGGFSHRINLADGYLVKKEHIICHAFELYGTYNRDVHIPTLQSALRKIHAHRTLKQHTNQFVAVEIQTLEEAYALLAIRHELGIPHILMIDNKTPLECRHFVKEIRKKEEQYLQKEVEGLAPEVAAQYLENKRVVIEASGRITEQNIEDYLKAGVNVVSMSDLIYQAKPIDMHLVIVGKEHVPR